jgi:hypothetical protein
MLGVPITAGAPTVLTHVESRGAGPGSQLSHLTGWLEMNDPSQWTLPCPILHPVAGDSSKQRAGI